jgi:hypothetical protein
VPLETWPADDVMQAVAAAEAPSRPGRHRRDARCETTCLAQDLEPHGRLR